MFFLAPDFWTTKCERCPDALDKLDALATSVSHSQITFISICCDSCDGARAIIEHSTPSRWLNVSHYFASPAGKEVAKEHYGFKAVPFYVVADEGGNVVMMGGAASVDLAAAPGVVADVPTKVSMDGSEHWGNDNKGEEKKENHGFARTFSMEEDF